MEQHDFAGTLAGVLESCREDRLALKASAWHRDGPLVIPELDSSVEVQFV